MPCISIIIPVYNAAATIKKTVDSILNQTYKDYEIIIVNDGSTDDSKSVIEKLQAEDSRITVINTVNSGSSEARNTGIRMSNGKFIAFCDADDEYRNDALEKLYSSQNNTNADLIISGYETFVIKNNNYIKSGETLSDEKAFLNKEEIIKNIDKLLQINVSPFSGNLFNPCWNKLYKADIIKNNDIYFEKEIVMGEDYRFNLKYVEHISSASIIPDITYKYYVLGNSLSNKFRKDDFIQRCNNYEMTEKFLESRGYFEKEHIYEKYVAIAFSTFASFHLKQNTMNKQEKKDYFKYIINNKDIVSSMNFKAYNSYAIKIASIILRTKNYFIINSISYILYKMRGFS